MTAAFAAIEAATATSAVAALANAEAVIGGTTYRVIFDAAYADPLGIAGSSPVAELDAADWTASSATTGDTITVDGDSYTITGVEPDGTGMVRLRLQEA